MYHHVCDRSKLFQDLIGGRALPKKRRQVDDAGRQGALINTDNCRINIIASHLSECLSHSNRERVPFSANGEVYAIVDVVLLIEFEPETDACARQ